MARVLLSKGKERAKAKIKAGQKANASKPSNFSLYDTQVRYSGGKPVVPAAPKKAAAPVKKAETKKVEPKKPVTVVNAKGKTIYDPKARTITTYSSKGKTVVDKNPESENYGTTVSNKKGTVQKLKDSERGAANTVIKNKKGTSIQYNKKGEPGYDKIVKDKTGFTRYSNDNIYKNDKKGPRYIKRKPETKKVEVKKVETKSEVVNNNLTIGPTVSQLWKEKTGTSWSEAKSLGLTDGSASANIDLMKKLKSGSINKNTIKSDKAARDIEPFKKEMERNVQDELSGKIKFDEPVPEMKKGGSVRKMRKDSTIKRKK